MRQTGTASTTSPAMSGNGRPLRGRPTTRRRATRRFMHAVRLAQKTSANRTGELSRAVRTCAHLRTAIATDLRLDKVMAYAAQPVISDFAACSLPSLRGSQRPRGPALDIRSVIYWPTRRSVGRGRPRPMASSTPVSFRLLTRCARRPWRDLERSRNPWSSDQLSLASVSARMASVSALIPVCLPKTAAAARRRG